ncbi:MAG: 2OG-Fe(II) oxygenase [Pseudomonadota bacterium]
MSTAILEEARNTIRPSRDEMLRRAPSVHHFWNTNQSVFEEAWSEWERAQGHGEIALDRSLYSPGLLKAVEAAWSDPSTESAVADLFEEVFPGVYKAQFFNPDKLGELREYMERVADSGIPLRPPYGIVLNRGGGMLDPRSEGYLAAPTFQTFYRDLMDHFMRPIARLLFPDIYGYDSQTFGFSIHWKAGGDEDLRAHTDASSVTLNINLNLPGEDYGGSAVRFMDTVKKQFVDLSFEPGVALIHHGSAMHASMPIKSGERRNFVLWLYGEHGQIPYRHGFAGEPVSAANRWTVPTIPSDGSAPF